MSVLPAELLDGMAEAYSKGFAEGRSGDQDAAMAGFYVYNNVGIAFRCFATGILFGLGSLFFLLYNGLVTKRNRIDEALGQIEVQLKRRHDLIPNLVQAVKGYMGFEQDVLTRVTEARANAVAAGASGPAQQANAENALTGALRSLFAVVENYPDLKANQNVMQLQEELTTTENQIGFSRQHYNATVLDYNNTIQTIPSVLIAGPLGFTKREFFDAEPEAEAVPSVDLTVG